VKARVLVTGVRGQVASYLAEELVREGHEVVGLTRGADDALPAGVERARGSLALDALDALLDDNGPVTAVVHLASATSMAATWHQPMETFDLNGRVGAALAFAAAARKLRLVHASSAEIFGRAPTPIQNEATPIDPISPYGVAKAAAHHAVRFGRRERGAPLSNLIFYLAESPRRRPDFVMRKITRTVAQIAAGRASRLMLGNTSAIRDFSHAKDMASAAKLLALGADAGDYVCASGEGHSVQEIVDTAFRLAGLDASALVEVDAALFRPNDIASLVGDNRALQELGWRPTVGFEALVQELYEYEVALARA
jgi:GDPmannose 4,6-dehydratase